jgi:hypothetical protein
VGFNITGQLLIRLFIHQTLEKKNGSTMRQYFGFIDFNKAYVSVRREVLYNILMEFAINTKLVRLIKMCLIEEYSIVPISKHLPHNSPLQGGLKQGDALMLLLFDFTLEYAIWKV